MNRYSLSENSPFQNIMSHHGQGGKLAFRIYPSWVKLEAKAAIKTQQWQLQHFFLTWQKEMIDLQKIFYVE